MSILCKSVGKPCLRDWNAVKEVMPYHADFKLKLYADSKLQISGSVDVDWAGDTTDRKSTSGYLFQLGGRSISWSSRKQMSVAVFYRS